MVARVKTRSRGSIFTGWAFRHKIETLITLAIVLDWLPAQLFAEGSLVTSATKLIVFPLLIIDFLYAPAEYLRPSYGWIYLIGLLLGTGGGVIMGAIGFSTLWSLLPNVGILLFYLKARSWEDTRNILYAATIASAVVPIWLILAAFGVVDPDILIEGREFSRFFAGPNRSSLGLLVAFIPASLGGVLLLRTQKPNLIAALGLIALSLFGPLFTGQRSANLAVWICLGFSWVSALRKSKVKRSAPYVIIILMLLVIGWSLWNRGLASYARPITMRLQNYGEAEVNAEYRIRMYQVFFEEITTSFSMIATGYEPASLLLGGGYHFILGEAYTLGGFFLFAVLLGGLIRAGWRLGIRWWKAGDDFAVATVLLSLFIGFLVNQFTHAGLNVRVVYFLLGLWLARNNNNTQRLTRNGLAIKGPQL